MPVKAAKYFDPPFFGNLIDSSIFIEVQTHPNLWARFFFLLFCSELATVESLFWHYTEVKLLEGHKYLWGFHKQQYWQGRTWYF